MEDYTHEEWPMVKQHISRYLCQYTFVHSYLFIIIYASFLYVLFLIGSYTSEKWCGQFAFGHGEMERDNLTHEEENIIF
jgi:hypothetical protein